MSPELSQRYYRLTPAEQALCMAQRSKKSEPVDTQDHSAEPVKTQEYVVLGFNVDNEFYPFWCNRSIPVTMDTRERNVQIFFTDDTIPPDVLRILLLKKSKPRHNSKCKATKIEVIPTGWMDGNGNIIEDHFVDDVKKVASRLSGPAKRHPKIMTALGTIVKLFALPSVVSGSSVLQQDIYPIYQQETPSTPEVVTQVQNNNLFAMYEVKPGEGLEVIATKFGLTVNELENLPGWKQFKESNGRYLTIPFNLLSDHIAEVSGDLVWLFKDEKGKYTVVKVTIEYSNQPINKNSVLSETTKETETNSQILYSPIGDISGKNTPDTFASCKTSKSEKVFGVDVSKYQGNIDWERAYKEGNVRFAIVRSWHGDDETKEKFEANMEGAREAGIVAGAYFFLSDDYSVEEQVEIFLERYQPRAGDMIPWLDVEVDRLAKTKPKFTKAQRTERILEFLKIYEDKTGIRMGIYTNWDYPTNVLAPSSELSEYPFWYARPGYSACPKPPKTWDRYLIHQYGVVNAGKVPGFSGKVDINRFNGNLTDLQEWAVLKPRY